ncbi:hypothetical protein [Sinomicrobium oceani]|uniref:hypothetical protein n=1 Tax=Sinomicrobium oceani TaxID=1150368 RepID=UPI00227D461B|nr:hypothetical protein [Sinomicrobium oceani]
MKNQIISKNLCIESLIKEAQRLELNISNSYLKSYPYFIAYFQAIPELKSEHLVIGSHMVYGWMPRVLSYNGYDDERVLQLCNKAKRKEGALLKKEELEYLKSAINNSMVGLSKLLHFINPQHYAIWDSHILRYATGISGNPGARVGNVDLYLNYLKKLEIVAQDKRYPEIEAVVLKKLKVKKDTLYPYRVVEMVMFETQRGKKKG